MREVTVFIELSHRIYPYKTKEMIYMNKKVSLVVVGAVIVCATVFSIAGSVMAHTPLYILRMEQASSKMNFLPTAVNGFTYTTESGYTVGHNVTGRYCGGVNPLATSPASTCDPSCTDTCEETCPWTCYETCPNTCNPTCTSPTCPDTCPNTCDTCPVNTCPVTCEPTCEEFSCQKTCTYTCWGGETCGGGTCGTGSTCFYTFCGGTHC